MISADIKSNIKQQKIKELVAVFLITSHRSNFSKLEIQC